MDNETVTTRRNTFDRTYLLIGGEKVSPHSKTVVEVISPSTGEVIGSAPLADEVDVAAAASAARTAFDDGPWPRLPIESRREILLRAAELLDEVAVELNDLNTAETGALLRNMSGHIGGRVRYLASLEVPAPENRTAANGEQALVVHEPVGVVAAIVPWNAPVNLSITKVIPALLAGCTVVLKPAPETPLTAYLLAEALLAAGLPDGVLNVVAAGRAASESLVTNPDIDCVSFTGSTVTGRRIGALCGDSVKRVGLELGGKSPAILLDDADLDVVIPKVVAGGMILNNGEACCAWTRILVPESRHDEVVEALRAAAERVTIGDPFDPQTDLGPMISSAHRDKVEGYVQLAEEEGAEVYRPTLPDHLEGGWYVAPAILARSSNAMRSSREEIFGPVVSVIAYEDEDDAVRIANDSDYGLSAAVFTNDQERGMRLASRLRSGTVGINSLAFNIEFPFGGFKKSGIGRQHGPEGLLEYLEIKSIGVPSGAPAPKLETNKEKLA